MPIAAIVHFYSPAALISEFPLSFIFKRACFCVRPVVWGGKKEINYPLSWQQVLFRDGETIVEKLGEINSARFVLEFFFTGR